MIDYKKLKSRYFEPFTRHYLPTDTIHYAKGFGAGQDSRRTQDDAAYLADGPTLQALPMMAVALADGEFWQQDPSTGIVWQKIVHAAESIRIHTPLPAQGTVVVSQYIKDIFDRGEAKGAVMLQNQQLSDEQGTPLVDIEVMTILKGNGGFGGPPAPDSRPAPLPERTPDGIIELPTPTAQDTAFLLTVDLEVADSSASSEPKRMIRGVGCFGLAGRAALLLACSNQPERLQAFGVRYAGPMFTGETMRVSLWHLQPGKAVFRMDAVEREQAVLSHGYIEYRE